MNEFHCQLPVPVQVDPATGVWSLNGLPMLLVPRHFLINQQKAMEKGLGLERTKSLIWDASYAAARTWCAQQAVATGLTGEALFAHYLDSGNRRGYGRITLEQVELQAGRARVRVDQSVYVAEYGAEANRKVCYMFEGSYAGGMSWISEAAGLPGAWIARETQCAAHGASHCLFEVERCPAA